MRRARPLLFAAVVCLAAAGLTADQTPVPQTAGQPTFRTRVTMVPIDVRVLDSDGNPITDLTAKDFTILENGQRQLINHFSTMALTTEVGEPVTTPALERVLGERTDAITAQDRRVFLILIGRGRVIGPSNLPCSSPMAGSVSSARCAGRLISACHRRWSSGSSRKA